MADLTPSGIAAAIANAIHHAAGKRVRSLPITVDTMVATRRLSVDRRGEGSKMRSGNVMPLALRATA